MLFFAYDGSVNCDWIAHYAIRMAQAQPEPVLEVLHVQDDDLSESELTARLERLREMGEAAGIELRVGVYPAQGDVATRLESLVPAGDDSLLVCGTRVRQRGRGLLTGTVTERLLDRRHCRVLAMRVVHPGLLGRPNHVLVPLSGAPGALEAISRVLAMFAPDLHTLSLLGVERVRRGRLRRLGHEQAEALLAVRREYLGEAEQTLLERLPLDDVRLESQVVLSDDVTREIVNAANRTRSRMILMGATRRRRLERMWSGHPLESVLAFAPCDVAIHSNAAS